MQFSFTNPKILPLLESAVGSCPCGHTHRLETTACVIDENAAGLMGDFLSDYRKPLIFCDENTEIFAKALPFYHAEDCVVFPGNAHATEVQTAAGERMINEKCPDVLIACGSGSLHDITRYCAHAAGLPFGRAAARKARFTSSGGQWAGSAPRWSRARPFPTGSERREVGIASAASCLIRSRLPAGSAIRCPGPKTRWYSSLQRSCSWLSG